MSGIQYSRPYGYPGLASAGIAGEVACDPQGRVFYEWYLVVRNYVYFFIEAWKTSMKTLAWYAEQSGKLYLQRLLGVSADKLTCSTGRSLPINLEYRFSTTSAPFSKEFMSGVQPCKVVKVKINLP